MTSRILCALIPTLFLLASLSSCSTTSQITSGNSNQCMNVENHGYPVAGTPLRLKPCDPWQNQQWSLNNGQITGVGGFCLDLQGGVATDGTPVIYVPCDGRASQMWTAVNGTIIGMGGKCIDVGSDPQANRPPLIIASCNGSSRQVWLLH